MAERGRPRKEGVQVHILLDPDLAKRLDRYVNAERGANKTYVINRALRKFLDEEEKNFRDGG